MRVCVLASVMDAVGSTCVCVLAYLFDAGCSVGLNDTVCAYMQLAERMDVVCMRCTHFPTFHH